MDRIVAWVAVVVLAIASFFFYQKAGDAASKAEEAKSKYDIMMKTKVDAGLLVKARQLTFAKIEDSFSKIAHDSGMGWRADIEYVWVYPYNFGFDVPENWNWNLKEVEPGVVSLDVPPLKQLNFSPVAPKERTKINGANGTHLSKMIAKVTADAETMVKDREKYYLDNGTIQDTAKLGMAAFIMDILNANTPKDRLPIRKVIVNIRK